MGFYSNNSDVQARPTYGLDFGAVMRQVYLWMTLGLFVTAVTAFGLAASGATIRLFSNPVMMLGTLVVYMILAFTLQPIVMRSQPIVGILAYLAVTVVLGLVLSSIFFTYRLGTISFAFLATAGTFGAMSVIGYTTKVDLSKFGSILMMAVLGLVVASIINIFFASSALFWIINYAGVLIFAGLTAYDTQWIKNQAATIAQGGDGNAAMKIGLIGAFHLYIDFINLFLFILRIMGGGGGRRR